MDKELRARGLTSASVRKQRMQERQRQKDLMYEQREERRKRQMRYSEIYTTDSSDSSRANSPENDSAADTPSEYSVRTPDNSFSSPDIGLKALGLGGSSPKKEEEMQTHTKLTLLERRRSKAIGPKPPMLGASLNRPCDYRYDRFSTIMEPPELPEQEDEAKDEVEEESEGESSGSSSETSDDEDYSPIEVATPMAIRMPISKPSVVSVMTPSPGMPRFSVKNISTIMVDPPKAPLSRLREFENSADSRPRTASTSRNDSGFLASEAKPLEVATPSTESIVSLEPSSTASSRSMPIDQASVDNSLRKKSSMPMLTKFTHARMSSIKNFMKPPTVPSPTPAVPMLPPRHSSRNSENVNQILSRGLSSDMKPVYPRQERPASPRRSMTEPTILKSVLQEQRPQTARMQPPSRMSAIPPISTMPAPPARTPSPCEEDRRPDMSKKKSFQNLRRRSGSLGHALKMSMSSRERAPAPEVTAPPMPSTRVPERESVRTMNFPTPPPPKSARDMRKSTLGYSPFPPTVQREQPVGLGLRM